MNANQQYLSVLLFKLYKVVLTVESGDEILKCDHPYESYCVQYFPMVVLQCRVIAHTKGFLLLSLCLKS